MDGKRIRGLITRVLLPILIISVVVVASHRMVRSSDAGLVPYSWCWRQQTLVEDPAADVLLLGSSRSGLGIDPAFVQSGLEGDTFERVTFGGNNELEKNLGLRTYVANRGAPDTLVLELGLNMENAGFGEPKETRPFTVAGKVPLQFGTRQYAELVADLRDAGTIGLVDTYVLSDVKSVPAFELSRIDAGFSAAIRHPRSVIHRKTRDCPKRTRVSGTRWIHGNSKPYVEGETPLPEGDFLEKLETSSQLYQPVDLSLDSTQGELAMTTDMVEFARSVGVEHVIVMYMPPFGSAGDGIDLDAAMSALPDDVVRFDVRDVIRDDSRPGLRLQYHDISHLNEYAAREVSEALTAVLQDLRTD